MQKNFATNSFRFVVVELIGDTLYWPFWWYTKGLSQTAIFCLQSIKESEETLGVSVWVKNIFTPMFGQYDLEGRLISFFMRLAQIIFRSVALLLWVAFYIAIFIVWIVGPVFVFYQIWQNAIRIF